MDFPANVGHGQSVATADALYCVVGDGFVLRMSGTQVTEQHYPTCSNNCFRQIESVFATSRGTICIVDKDGQKAIMLERAINGLWVVVTNAVPGYPTSGRRVGWSSQEAQFCENAVP